MISLRTPKGTLDLSPAQSEVQNKVVEKITKIFKIHNGQPVNTPTFELRDLLLNKYGEDTKLIYNLENQGGDVCSLRYDLTVPFSRYLAVNKISRLRRYQIGNVFRRDNPSFKTGRLREFTQADFDICGEGLPMVHDAEILKMAYDIVKSLDARKRNENFTFSEERLKYTIKVNDRRMIMGYLFLAGVPKELSQTACSSIDKLDKLTLEDVHKELSEKGLNEDQISKIDAFISFKGTKRETLDFLGKSLKTYLENAAMPENEILKDFSQALTEFESLFKYISIYEVENINFDLSLARGLDYYTGLIFEVCYLDSEVGSVIGGGRYDNLCKSISNFSVPCVGFSVGVSRVCSLCELIPVRNDIFVGSGYGLMLEERLKIQNDLWDLGLRTETFSGKRVNFKEQVEYCKKNNFATVIFTGENEFKNNVLSILDLTTGDKREISRSDLKNYILNRNRM